MKKIAFIGATYAALVAAKKLGNDFDVTIYESKSEGEVYYDWRDDMTVRTFSEIGYPLPPKEIYNDKFDWVFITPDRRSVVPIRQAPDDLNISVWRRPLHKWLSSFLPDSVKVMYNTVVTSLIIKEEVVVGLVVNGENIDYDLVVDCSGLFSPFLNTLPEKYNIKPAKPNEIIYTYRAFYEKTPYSKTPESRCKAYLRFGGINGICWCNYDHDGKVDVLIGSQGNLTDRVISSSIPIIEEDNLILSKKLISGGKIIPIPFRYPLTQAVADGYVALGDSAYMTIPLLASGMASSMTAASMLADVILTSSDPFRVPNLWRYQVAFYKNFGALHCSVDILKRFLLDLPEKSLNFLIGKKVVDEDDLAAGAAGVDISLPLKAILTKAKRGIGNLPLVIRLGMVVNKSTAVKKLASSIPEVYDEQKVTAWRKKLDGVFGN